MPLTIYPFRAALDAATPLGLSINDPYRDTWFDWATNKFAPVAQVGERIGPALPFSPEPSYQNLVRYDLDVSAFPDGCYQVYVHDLSRPERPLSKLFAVQDLGVFRGTTQYSPSSVNITGIANVNFTYPAPAKGEKYPPMPQTAKLALNGTMKAVPAT